MRQHVLLFLVLPLFACSATLENRLSRSDPNAPVNEIEGGTVSYLNQGADFVINARRKDAYLKMHNSCDGPYRILEEGENLREGIATPVGSSIIYGQTHYTQIKFECVHQ